MRINRTISSPQVLGIFDVSDESKVRFVVENAGPANVILVRAKIKGQANFTSIKTITGAVSEVVNVFTYEELQVECTVYDSTTNEITILASSFNEAGGSAIESIGVPFGSNLTDIETLTLTSSDSSITITGDNLTKSIDFTTSGTGLPYVPSTPSDWSPAPTTVGEGLDQLADRVDSIEDSVGAANGIAPLNSLSKIDSIYLPSYVDDVEEYANLLAFPLTGETSKIYVALDTNKTYRWSGTTYIEISPSEVNSVNGYTGIITLDKSDIGLGNVDNTSDLDKPISNDTQDALDLKVDKAGDTMTGPLNMSALSENIQFSVYGLNATQGIEIKSYDDATRPTGNITIKTGNASGSDAAGAVYIQGGSNVDGNPGNILLTAGQSSGLGSDGVIVLDAKGVVYLNDNAAGSIDAGSHRIQNVEDPISDQDAATRKWVDEMSAIDNVLFVSPNANAAIADGSLHRPYATIAAALAVALNNNVIALLPGTYNEPTVVIPSSLSSLVIQGVASSSTVITNGISYTPDPNIIDLLIQKVNIGVLNLDATAAFNGLVTLKQVIVNFSRQDGNTNVFMIVTESNCFGGVIKGGGNNFSECLIVVSMDIESGALAIFENTKFVGYLSVYGNATVRLLDCDLFGAPFFVDGSIDFGFTPTIEIDTVSDYLGSLNGDYTKVLLANIPLSNLDPSGANPDQYAKFDGANWIPSNLEASITDYSPNQPSDWTVPPVTVSEGLDELASRVTDIDSEIITTSNIFTDTKEPTGFVNRTDSIISFDNLTRIFNIQPAITSYSIYHLGVKTTISTSLDITIPNNSGNYYIYINNLGALVYTTTFDLQLISSYAYCAYIYWDAIDGKAVIFGDERHGITMDGTTHAYLHTTRGTQLVSGASIGYTLGTGALDADAQISLSDMQIKDEDITVNINNDATPNAPFEQILFPIAEIPIVYREGSIWKKAAATQFPMLVQVGDVRASYNEYTGLTWQLTEAPSNNKTLVTYIFATTSVDEPVIGILGQQQYNNIDEARGAASWENISFGDLPSPEMKLLYTLYYDTSSGYANAAKSKITYVADLRFTHDREVSAAVFNSDHANLSGLAGDDHLQYHNDARGDIRYYTKTQIDTDVIKKAGTTAFTGDQSMGGNKLTNLANPVALTDAVNLQTLNAALGSSGDIPEKSYSIADNQVVATNITDFVFSNGTVRSFEALVSVAIIATSNLYETFEVRGVQKASSWFISISSEGDNSGVTLSINSSGQMQYTSASYAGFVSGTLKFRAITTSV